MCRGCAVNESSHDFMRNTNGGSWSDCVLSCALGSIRGSLDDCRMSQVST